ncbi:helix-turn-helix transcriptional regulator [Clostridioides sp. ES-S-0145-01]|uniref:helix-turn-helix domain-containing protein n=1 Tax=unclassified Clostridioides TaxID=2635829 RepID=UPI001D12E7E4|nr:helix-turn-helix transcriptional regulator [Clostridioides sp. ES-S-0145-01]UDN56785.1 helix-turn-helix transcriptional regulator [Clostridioides sp. ES-S-0010-02]
MDFSTNLRNILEKKQLRQADLCRITGIQTSLMSDYIKGKKSPAISNAILIADALNMSLDILVGKDKTSIENIESENSFELNEKFKKIREELALSQSEFGESIGLTKSSISNIENNSRNVTEKHIKLICNELNVNEDWIRFGSGDMFIKTDINERLKLVRLYFNLSQKDFGSRLTIAQNYLSNIEKGYRNVTDKIIKITCFEFNINEEWLRTGTGNMFTRQDDILQQVAIEYNLDESDIKIFRNYLKLSKDERNVIKKYFFSFSDKAVNKD